MTVVQVLGSIKFLLTGPVASGISEFSRKMFLLSLVKYLVL